MAGLVPAIHILFFEKLVDARVKPGHDESWCFYAIHLIGSCTVTSLVPSGNVASTWIS
jgi:hypothetical protein